MAAFLAFQNFKQLRVIIVDGGLGGLAAAVALRRAGHLVDIFEGRENIEVSTSTSYTDAQSPCYNPDTRSSFSMNIDLGEWEIGKVQNQQTLEKYEDEWEAIDNTIRRQSILHTLLEMATSIKGKGAPCNVFTGHTFVSQQSLCRSTVSFCSCDSIGASGTLTFKNGLTVTADLIICADTRAQVNAPENDNRWFRRKVCILGDEVMSPTMSQGASQEIEDAAALGIIFSDKYDFTRNVAAGLELHQKVRASERKPIFNGYNMRDHVAEEVSRLGIRNGIQLSLLSHRLKNDRVIFAMRM
ncbi:hypothetical protein B0H13DRAFT_1938620 [Mycena leptocephala]|nr:hypothetical protein B0H13DRAFT_1938620 [Mycena leptocephala]